MRILYYQLRLGKKIATISTKCFRAKVTKATEKRISDTNGMTASGLGLRKALVGTCRPFISSFA